MSNKRDVIIKPPVAEAYAEGFPPTIQAIKDELKAIIEVNPKIFALVVLFIVGKNFIPLFLQSLPEIPKW